MSTVIADAVGGPNQSIRHYYRRVRPRNVAFLACIFAGV